MFCIIDRKLEWNEYKAAWNDCTPTFAFPLLSKTGRAATGYSQQQLALAADYLIKQGVKMMQRVQLCASDQGLRH